MSGPTAVVVGGGIAGLSAAFDFHRAGWNVIVHEAGDRWGGKLLTSPVGDRPVDAGPDAFLARVEHGYQLCFELGLEDALTSPVAPVPAYVYADNKLHELPSGTILGVPTDLVALARSDLVSADAIEQAQADLFMPSPDLTDDLSIGAICRQRLGEEITDRLIDPLLGAINASDIDHLSLNAAAPQLANALRTEGSLIRGLNRFRSGGGPALGSRDPDKPVFYGLPGGVAQIVDGLIDELADADLRLNSPVNDLSEVKADAIVLAVPTFSASHLLTQCSEASDVLDQFSYSDVAQVTVELPASAFEQVLDASGILFPRFGGTLMTACTWLSTKWAHYRRSDSVLIRLSAGRFGDDRPAALTDEQLVKVLLGELSMVEGIGRGEVLKPLATRVQRWPKAFPQYTPGHLNRVETIRNAVRDFRPEIALVGAPFDGIGIPACIASGRMAAAQALGQQ